MSFNLPAAGWYRMAPHGQIASGERPLLVVVCKLNGASGTPTVDLKRIFGDPQNPKTRNVRDYFLAVSCGQFTWKPAHTQEIEIELDAAESALGFGDRLLAIYAAIEKQENQTGFHFSNFVSSPLSNGKVLYRDLSILVIDNGSNRGGRSSYQGPAICTGTPPAQLTQLDYVIGYSYVGAAMSSADFLLVAHELSHTLGTIDLYGPNPPGNLNERTTLMGRIPAAPASCHLDPWHKMRLGWIKPRVHDLKDPQPHFLDAAGQSKPEGTVILFDEAHGIYEYFILEFRNEHPDVAGEYDQDAHDTGLVIWHVKTAGGSVWMVGKDNLDELDPIKELVKKEVDGVMKDLGDYRGVFYLGRPPVDHTPLPKEVDPNFARGYGYYWHGGDVTPQLTWYDGSPTGVRLSVRPFTGDAKGIFVDVLDNSGQLPRSAELVAAGPTRMNFAWVDQEFRITAACWDSDGGPPGSWRTHNRITEPLAALKQSLPVLLALPDGSREEYWIQYDGAILAAGCGPGPLDMGDWTAAQTVAPALSAKANARIAVVARNPDHRDLFWVHEDGSLRSSWRDTYFNSGRWNQFTLVEADKAWKPASPGSLAAVASHPQSVRVYWGASDGSIIYALWRHLGGWIITGNQLMPPGALKTGGKILAVSKRLDEVDLFWQAPDNSLCMKTITYGRSTSPVQPHPPGGGLSSPTTVAPGTRVHPNGEFVVTALNQYKLMAVWRTQANMLEESIFDGNHWTAPAGIPRVVTVKRLIGVTSRTETECDLVWIGPNQQVWWAHRKNNVTSGAWDTVGPVFATFAPW